MSRGRLCAYGEPMKTSLALLALAGATLLACPTPPSTGLGAACGSSACSSDKVCCHETTSCYLPTCIDCCVVLDAGAGATPDSGQQVRCGNTSCSQEQVCCGVTSQCYHPACGEACCAAADGGASNDGGSGCEQTGCAAGSACCPMTHACYNIHCGACCRTVP